jgi:hypothetical protein
MRAPAAPSFSRRRLTCVSIVRVDTSGLYPQTSSNSASRKRTWPRCSGALREQPTSEHGGRRAQRARRHDRVESFPDASASWAHVVDYCFRGEGRLARLTGTFNSLTVGGPGPGVRRRRTTYYDAAGAVLETQSGVFDIDSDKALPSAPFVDQDDPLYPTVRALPFSADLFPPAATVDPDPNGLAAVVRGRVSSVKAWYDQALRRAPGLAGKAVARWTVDIGGEVTAFSWQSNEMKSATFSLRAERVIESWTFGPRGAPTVVSFPFVFGGPGTEESVSPSGPSSDATTFAGPAAASR